MRGYIFEIAEKKEELHTINHNDFEDTISSLGVDRIKTLEKNDRDFVVGNFIDKLIRLGARKTEDGGFVITKEAKLNHFRERFQLFKQLAETLTLEEFSTSMLDTLKSHIAYTFGDVIYDMYDGEYDFDDWLRLSDVNTTYYIGNVIQMG